MKLHESPGIELPIFLIGTKADRKGEVEVKRNEAEEIAAKFSLPYYETSSKDNTGIAQAIEDMTTIMITKFGTESEYSNYTPTSGTTIDSKNSSGKQSEECVC